MVINLTQANHGTSVIEEVLKRLNGFSISIGVTTAIPEQVEAVKYLNLKELFDNDPEFKDFEILGVGEDMQKDLDEIGAIPDSIYKK